MVQALFIARWKEKVSEGRRVFGHDKRSQKLVD